MSEEERELAEIIQDKYQELINTGLSYSGPGSSIWSIYPPASNPGSFVINGGTKFTREQLIGARVDVSRAVQEGLLVADVAAQTYTATRDGALARTSTTTRQESMMIGLDFETYSDVDLTVHGMTRYMASPYFQPLIGCTHDWAGNKRRIDIVRNKDTAPMSLRHIIGDNKIVAHNAAFEKAVLHTMGLDYPSSRFIDSAVIARAAGGGSRLEAAAPQLLGFDKMEEGRDLIRLFCIPTKAQLASGDVAFNPQVIDDNPHEWNRFNEYCDLDSELSYKLANEYGFWLTPQEMAYQAITMDMNFAGWAVDIDMVEEMQRRYQENMKRALEGFRVATSSPDLNLNSLKQMKEWCKKRGVNANSFAEKPLLRLLKKLEAKAATMQFEDPKLHGYNEVIYLLRTKQQLGGSSLKKLQTIKDTALDGRLYDQYLHCGAGQSLRTTGRSVQMQNLKRLSVVEDMAELTDEDNEWDNEKLGRNLRQVFTASHPQGQLVVGDFASVESRGLAWLSNEEWKLTAYRQGDDLYKVLATSMFGIGYADVTKEQRQIGKVGELSCGYGAGAGAVQMFAENMGLEMNEAEAAKLVWDWRDANPKIVTFWDQLNAALVEALQIPDRASVIRLRDGFNLTILQVDTPRSLVNQHPKAKSILMKVTDENGLAVLSRYFHGCYFFGRNISYYRASDRKTGDLWKPTFVDPKTKQTRRYELYGGKLAGILTQSFCRELFFRALTKVDNWIGTNNQVTLVGQFHDEIVLDWEPGAWSLDAVKRELGAIMSDPGAALPSFPMAAEVKSDYRYTK